MTVLELIPTHHRSQGQGNKDDVGKKDMLADLREREKLAQAAAAKGSKEGFIQGEPLT